MSSAWEFSSRPEFRCRQLKNNGSVSHLHETATPAFRQTRMGVDVSQQNERITLKNTEIVRREVRRINPFDEVELL
jgi:hypothetical protein